jgi:predicted nucleic acid-binding protein
VILADTTIWIDHMRRHNAQMQTLLNSGQVLMHPTVVAELALGSLHDRKKTFAELDKILQVRMAPLNDVRQMIEARVLYAKGIGLTDAHLIASCLIVPGVKLWTRDTRLRAVSQALGIDAGLP